MNNYKFVVGVASLASALTCLVGSDVSARSLNGHGAFAPINSTQACVVESWGIALNNCASTQSYMLFNLPVDSTGNKTARLTTAGSSGAGFSCYSQVLRHDASWQWSGALQPSNPAPTIDILNFPALYVESAANLRVVCQNVPVGRGIASLAWAI